MLVFLEYIFHFFISKALPALNSVSSRISGVKVLKMINLTAVCSISCRGTKDNQLTFHVRGLGFNSCHLKLFLSFILLVLLFWFYRKTYFHFLTDLKYTGRVIAGSL